MSGLYIFSYKYEILYLNHVIIVSLVWLKYLYNVKIFLLIKQMVSYNRFLTLFVYLIINVCVIYENN